MSAVQIGSRKIFDGAAFVADNTHAHYGTGGKRMAATAVLGISTDPKAVADAIRELIATPAGKRPIRTTVGLDLGVGELNRAAAPFQRSYLRAMGLEGTEVVAS